MKVQTKRMAMKLENSINVTCVQLEIGVFLKSERGSQNGWSQEEGEGSSHSNVGFEVQ